MKYIVPVLIFLFLFGSCSVNTSLIIEENGAGKMESQVELSDFFGEFFFDIFERGPLLDEFRTGFAENGFQHVILRENSEYAFTQYFAFADINSLPGLSEGILELKRTENIQSLSIKINRDNWDDLQSLFPLLADPSISYLGPEGSQGLSRNEFHEMLLYPFEDYAASPLLATEALDASVIEIRVQVPGEIDEILGGSQINENEAEFLLPLFDILMLDRDIEFGVSYR